MSKSSIIKLALVEDSRGTRENLVSLMKRSSTVQCVGSFANAESALQELPKLSPDVVLMDINLPSMNGIECVAILKELLPNVQVLMLTTYDEGDSIFKSLRAGASGYLLKNMKPGELVAAIEQVHAGGSPMSMHIARKVVGHFKQIKITDSEVDALSVREKEVLALLAQGFLYKEIADQLHLSISTVRAHLHTVYGKLHVQSRTQAVVKFMKQK